MKTLELELEVSKRWVVDAIFVLRLHGSLMKNRNDNESVSLCYEVNTLK